MGDIETYVESQSDELRVVCERLRSIIESELPASSSKLYHGAPVWFLNDDPIVGFSKKKEGISLLFWSGGSFEEPGLKPVGKFKAAEAMYRDESDLDPEKIKKWLGESSRVVWDYKNLAKNKGELKRA